MPVHSFRAEAEDCRRRAQEFSGRAEAVFLLRVAESFDALADTNAQAGLESRPRS